MKANFSLLIGLVFAGLTPLSVAQVPIAPGVYACDGAAQAGPCNGGGSGGTNSSSSSPYGVVGYAHAAPKWADRWGAIADDGKGIFGIVSNMSSKRIAENSALDECKNRNGGDCKVQLTYHNQCAAVAASTSATFSSGSPTLEEAKSRAMKRCIATGNQCWVYYSGCSLPEQIQ